MKTTRKQLALNRETLQALESGSLRHAAAGFTGVCGGTGSCGGPCTTQNVTAASQCRTCF